MEPEDTAIRPGRLREDWGLVLADACASIQPLGREAGEL
jgi:hypothetical protein